MQLISNCAFVLPPLFSVRCTLNTTGVLRRPVPERPGRAFCRGRYAGPHLVPHRRKVPGFPEGTQTGTDLCRTSDRHPD